MGVRLSPKCRADAGDVHATVHGGIGTRQALTPDPVRLTRCSPAQCERSRCEWEEAMLKQHIAACLVGTVLATAPALAQTSPAPTSPPASKAPSGMSGQFITQQSPGQWRASKLVGVDVHGTDNAKIGDVREGLCCMDRLGGWC